MAFHYPLRLFDPFFRERFRWYVGHRFVGPTLRAFSSGSSRGLAGDTPPSEVFKNTRTEAPRERARRQTAIDIHLRRSVTSVSL